MERNQPVSFKERIHEIDAIRGFALLGILMMNIMAFSGPDMEDSFNPERSEIYTGFFNELSLFFINTFVTANFFTMFSFLFGLGFFIFLSRAEEKGRRIAPLFYRRMFILLIFGLLHGILLWYGDILWTYAIAGMILFFFYKLSPKVNLIVAISLLTVITSLILLGALALYLMGDQAMGNYSLEIGMTEAILNGSYSDIISMNMTLLGISVSGIIFVVPIVLAMFLIGLAFGQMRIFENLSIHMSLLKKIACFGLGIGLPIKIMTGYFTTYAGNNDFYATIGQLSSSLGGPLMALGYVALMLILMQRYRQLVTILQPVGQMALTNYIGQTVIMLLIFYVGGLFNSVDAVWFIPIVLVVFLVQIGLSKLWMKHFSYGPLEWIWRTLTYLKVMPIKKKSLRNEITHY